MQNNNLIECTATFIYNDTILTYKIKVREDLTYNKNGLYNYIQRASVRALSMFDKKQQHSKEYSILFWLSTHNFKTIFIGSSESIEPIKVMIDGKEINYTKKNKAVPLYSLIKGNMTKYTFDNKIIINNLAICDIPNNISELYIVNNYNSFCEFNNTNNILNNILNNLPSTIEKLYLFHPIKTPITSLPSNIKKLYISDDITLESEIYNFTCEIIKVNISP